MKIGLILSGGMAKGAYQLGALRAIEHYFAPQDILYVSVASVGIINAMAFFSEQLEWAENKWLHINDRKEKLFLSSVLKSKYFSDLVEEASCFPVPIEKMYVPILNIPRREVIYPNLANETPEDKAMYVKAAVAFPPFTKAVKIHGRSYYDGALVDDIPFYPLMQNDLDYVICIYFNGYNYVFETDEFTGKVIKIPFESDAKFLKTSFWFEREGIERMMQEGYDKAKAALDEVFVDGTENLERIYAHIRERDERHAGSTIHITGDVIVSRANEVFRRFAKRQVNE